MLIKKQIKNIASNEKEDKTLTGVCGASAEVLGTKNIIYNTSVKSFKNQLTDNGAKCDQSD